MSEMLFSGVWRSLLKFISKNAYIMVAIYGRNFCLSAKDAFFLILLRNIVRVGVVDKITEFVLFISKMVIIGLIVIVVMLLVQEDVDAVTGKGDFHFFVIFVNHY
uniref:Choline transporter-like protein n=1 Tax=Macrostomum lignano TaxID=282301 RepID=A0A1I8F751_9PLAT